MKFGVDERKNGEYWNTHAPDILRSKYGRRFQVTHSYIILAPKEDTHGSILGKKLFPSWYRDVLIINFVRDVFVIQLP